MSTIPHSPFYRSHLMSRRWAVFRQEQIAAAGFRCERCHDLKSSLDVHHKHYLTLGFERPCDVEVLCRECHEVADSERREVSWRNRVVGFAIKKYGRFWEDRHDFEDVSDELTDWLDRRAA